MDTMLLAYFAFVFCYIGGLLVSLYFMRERGKIFRNPKDDVEYLFSVSPEEARRFLDDKLARSSYYSQASTISMLVGLLGGLVLAGGIVLLA